MEDRQINIQPADRLSLVQEYYFSRKLKEVAQLNAEGHDIISLAIGSPDMPPSPQTVQTLWRWPSASVVGSLSTIQSPSLWPAALV